MIRGLYSAATGMLAQQATLDALAGNLANINTTGFKQDVPTFKALHDLALQRLGHGGGMRVGPVGTGVRFDSSVTDLSAGTLVPTGNPLDLALNGDGFFTVQTARGERYTRAGDFHVQQDGKGADGKPAGYLADSLGNRVLGEKGPITFSALATVAVMEDGTVVVDGKAVDKLRLASAPAASLVKEGGNLLSIRGTVAESKAHVRSGSLEQSNVNAVAEMVRMITVQRAYEAAQHAITAQDESLGKAVNEVSRV